MAKEHNAPSPGQLRAMTESGRPMLVSAAAGSGKTYTLVERIVRNLVAGTYRIDELLVVTFTNAAAAEMRARIEKKLTEALDEHPALAHQLVLLPNASISTIHAFCQRLIRENFTAIDIDPKFRLLGDQERELMRQRVVRELFARQYEEHDEAFLRFAHAHGSDHDDEPLYEMVLAMHDFAESQPEPDVWFSGVIGRARDAGRLPLEKTSLYPYFVRRIGRALESCGDVARYFARRAKQGGLYTYTDAFAADSVMIERLSRAAATGTWAAMREAFCAMPKFATLKKPPKMEIDKQTVDFYSGGRTAQIKEPLKKLKATYFAETEDSLLDDMRAAGEDVAELCRLARGFADAFAAAKRKKAALDFGDLEHFALAILKQEPVIGAIKTRYKEIMVDEYQDTNGVQEAILGRITNERNLFMVGDVKQSIYRFRLADPTLFMEKQASYRANPAHGTCVELGENYRSRGEVLSAVNFLFSQLMAYPEMELRYDEEAALYPKADYPEGGGATFSGAPVEVLLLEGGAAPALAETGDNPDDAAETEDSAGFEAEAEVIARRLRALKDGGVCVYDKDKCAYRALRWQDVAILLRAVQGKSQLLLEKLRAHDIPAYAEVDTGYFEEKEVGLVLALLSVIDNAHQDIPLAAVLHSIVGGMTSEELARVRADAGDGVDFYAGLAEAARKDVGGKAACFLENLARWRKMARRIGVPELLWQLYRDTHYYDYVGAQPGGLVRQANLRMLVDRAAEYEKTNFRGLFRFLKFIRQMKDRGTDLSVARTLGEKEDVVRIMTVHKSKGLEFPVVVLADLSKKFNLRDAQKKLLVHRKFGAEMYRAHKEGALAWQYPTVAWRALQEAVQGEAKAEELRVLYVALTRAREKLILVGSAKPSPEKCARGWCRHLERTAAPLPGHAVLGASSWLDWIGMALARYVGGDVIRGRAGVSETPRMEYPFSSLGEPKFDIRFVSADSREENETGAAPDEWVDRMRAMKPLPVPEDAARSSVLSWRYAWPTDIAAKMTVTEIKRRAEEPDEAGDAMPPTWMRIDASAEEDAVRRNFPPPAFLQQEEIKSGGVAFGMLMHDVMQKLHLDGKLDAADIESQINRMAENGDLTEEERRAVRVSPIAGFFASKLGRRMKAAKKCWREQPFSLLLPASEMDPRASENDEIFLQGTIDVFFEDADGRLVLLDYKTDRNTTREGIKKRYHAQLCLYARAIQAIVGKAVDEMYIYRLSDGDTVAL